MANEITINASLQYLDADGTAADIDISAALQTVTTKQPHRFRQLIPITEVALNLGPLASLGWAMFKNLDPTNFLELRVGTGGIKFIRIPPLKSAGPFFFGSGVTAPYVIADTNSCWLDALICAP